MMAFPLTTLVRGCGKRPVLRGQAQLISLLTSIVFAWLPLAANPAEAEPDWTDVEYGHFARNEPLRSMLYDFTSSVSLPAIISPKITASVNGNFPTARAEDFLTDLARTYNLPWIFDSTTMYIYAPAEISEEVVELPYAYASQFQDYMEMLDIRGAPLKWKVVPAQDVLQVSGPPRFVELVAEIAKRLQGEATSASAPQDVASPEQNSEAKYVVRIFNIAYGYVDDAVYNATGNKSPVINFTEILGKLMGVEYYSGGLESVVGAQRGNRGAPGSGSNGTGLSWGQYQQQQQGAGGATADPNANIQRRPVAGVRSKSYIVSDPRLNAIIVRDLEERMPIYERLIKELDRPLDQIEIEVSVLDVDASDMAQLGFDWQSRYGHIFSSAQEGAGVPIVYNNTLSSDEFSGLIVNISALETEGKSRILTRPSVLTLDNHEALFQNNQTFYVRLVSPTVVTDGAAVDLVPVSYGSLLKVRPHIVYEEKQRKIHLAIHVEDGRRSASSREVSGVPEIAQNVIQTQAVIHEGQSLLIGGYNIRERISERRRIPILGRTPGLGLLFSRKSDTETSIARYFVITPRIVDTSIDFELGTGFDEPEIQ